MKYHELQTTVRQGKRQVGRGIAAGRGKTAGRGTKGQNSRAGASRRPGFEGGQNPLMQRLPKLHGFRSLNQKAQLVYTGQLDKLTGKTITSTTLSEHGLISSPYVAVKLLAKGELTKKVNVELQSASAGAIKAIEQAGGTFTKTSQLSRPATRINKTEQ